VLKHGGKVALAAWTTASDNKWSSAPVKAAQERGIIEKDPPGQPGQFAWGEPGALEENLQNAGFVEFDVTAVDFAMRYDDLDDWWVAVTLTSTRMGDADKAMDYAQRSDVLADLERVAEPFEQPDGSLVIPARTWVAVATA
jgi:hypothetical protein